MANFQHANVTGADIHQINRWTFTDVAARNAQAVTADDIGKAAIVQSTGSIYVLTSVGPAVWADLTAVATYAALADKPTTLDGFGLTTEVNTKIAAGAGIDLVRYLNMPGTLAVFTGKLKWYPPLSINMLYIFPQCDIAPVGGNINLALRKNGSVVASASIPAGETVGAKLPLTGITALDTDYFTIDVTSVGSTTPGSDMVISLGYEYV